MIVPILLAATMVAFSAQTAIVLASVILAAAALAAFVFVPGRVDEGDASTATAAA
jgi:hypothetical protein